MLHRISCWIYSNWRKCTYRYCRRTCGISEIYYTFSGIILGAGPANERRRYIVTSSLVDWAHTHNDPCLMDQKFWCWYRTIPNKPWCCWCPGSLFRQVIRWHDIGITPGTVWHMARRSSVENWCEVQVYFHFFSETIPHDKIYNVLVLTLVWFRADLTGVSPPGGSHTTTTGRLRHQGHLRLYTATGLETLKTLAFAHVWNVTF